jgi:hypothetical protein
VAAFQLQPQPPPQQEPPEPEMGPEDDDPPFALLPFPCAANTESWIVFFPLSHFGHVIDCF